MTIDIEQLLQEIKDTASTIIKKDVTTVRGFSQRQITGIATQTSLIASGILHGEITDATKDFFLDQLILLTQNFVNTLVGLLLATIEKLWNAIVGVLWNAISKVTGLQLADFKPL